MRVCHSHAGAAPPVTAPIRLVRASFVIDLWQRGETIPPRQQLPPAAFYEGLPAAAEIVAISCPWLTDEHPGARRLRTRPRAVTRPVARGHTLSYTWVRTGVRGHA